MYNIKYDEISDEKLLLTLLRIRDDKDLLVSDSARTLSSIILKNYDPQFEVTFINLDTHEINGSLKELNQQDKLETFNIINKYCGHLLKTLGLVDEDKSILKDDATFGPLALAKHAESGFYKKFEKPTQDRGTCISTVTSTPVFSEDKDNPNDVNVSTTLFNVPTLFTADIEDVQGNHAKYDHPILGEKFIRKPIDSISVTFDGDEIIVPAETDEGIDYDRSFKFNGVENIGLDHAQLLGKEVFGRNLWNAMRDPRVNPWNTTWDMGNGNIIDNPYIALAGDVGYDKIVLGEMGDATDFNSDQFHLFNSYLRRRQGDIDGGLEDAANLIPFLQDLRMEIGVPTLQFTDDEQKSIIISGIADANPFLKSTKWPGKYKFRMLNYFDNTPFFVPSERGIHYLYSKPRVDQFGQVRDFPEDASDEEKALNDVTNRIQLTSSEEVEWQNVSNTDIHLNLYYVHRRNWPAAYQEPEAQVDTPPGRFRASVDGTAKPYISTGGPNYFSHNLEARGDRQHPHCYKLEDVNNFNNWRFNHNDSMHVRQYIVEVMNLGDLENAGHATFNLRIKTNGPDKIIDVTNLTDLAFHGIDSSAGSNSKIADETKMTTGFIKGRTDFAKWCVHPNYLTQFIFAGGQFMGSPANARANGLFELSSIDDVSNLYAGMPVFGPFVPEGSKVLHVVPFSETDGYYLPANGDYQAQRDAGTKVPGSVVCQVKDRDGNPLTTHFNGDQAPPSPRGLPGNDMPFYEMVFFGDMQNIRGGDGVTKVSDNEVYMSCALRSNRPLWTNSFYINTMQRLPLSANVTDSTKTAVGPLDLPLFLPVPGGCQGYMQMYYIPNYGSVYNIVPASVHAETLPFYKKFTNDLADQAKAIAEGPNASLVPFPLTQCTHDYHAYVQGFRGESAVFGECHTIVPTHRPDYITRHGHDNTYSRLYGAYLGVSNKQMREEESRDHLPITPYSAMLKDYPYDPRYFQFVRTNKDDGAGGELPYSPQSLKFNPVGDANTTNFYPYNFPFDDACQGYYYGKGGYAQLLVTCEGVITGIIDPDGDKLIGEGALTLTPEVSLFLDNRHINKIKPLGTGTIMIDNGASSTCYQHANIIGSRAGLTIDGEEKTGDDDSLHVHNLDRNKYYDLDLPLKYGCSGLLITSQMKEIRPDFDHFGGYNPCYGAVLAGDFNFKRQEDFNVDWKEPYYDSSTGFLIRYPVFNDEGEFIDIRGSKGGPGPYCTNEGGGKPYENMPLNYARQSTADVCGDNDPYYCCSNCACSPFSASRLANMGGGVPVGVASSFGQVVQAGDRDILKKVGIFDHQDFGQQVWSRRTAIYMSISPGGTTGGGGCLPSMWDPDTAEAQFDTAGPQSDFGMIVGINDDCEVQPGPAAEYVHSNMIHGDYRFSVNTTSIDFGGRYTDPDTGAVVMNCCDRPKSSGCPVVTINFGGSHCLLGSTNPWGDGDPTDQSTWNDNDIDGGTSATLTLECMQATGGGGRWKWTLTGVTSVPDESYMTGTFGFQDDGTVLKSEQWYVGSALDEFQKQKAAALADQGITFPRNYAPYCEQWWWQVRDDYLASCKGCENSYYGTGFVECADPGSWGFTAEGANGGSITVNWDAEELFFEPKQEYIHHYLYQQLYTQQILIIAQNEGETITAEEVQAVVQAMLEGQFGGGEAIENFPWLQGKLPNFPGTNTNLPGYLGGNNAGYKWQEGTFGTKFPDRRICWNGRWPNTPEEYDGTWPAQPRGGASNVGFIYKVKPSCKGDCYVHTTADFLDPHGRRNYKNVTIPLAKDGIEQSCLKNVDSGECEEDTGPSVYGPDGDPYTKDGGF